jgi:hypothetical protein
MEESPCLIASADFSICKQAGMTQFVVRSLFSDQAEEMERELAETVVVSKELSD